MSLRKPFIIVGDLPKPTCGDPCCDIEENPTHWVETELTPEAKEALRLFPHLVASLMSFKDGSWDNKTRRRALRLLARAKKILT